ncbi:PREDICTED: zinc finger MYM-type protein 1-like [Amphimedon queenslandica]|uniref:TTF-type domain-containing protein n=1 Tax=Amphimedon queenslandica TaxID=400682 RepID=A0A1X7TYR2_AMPQE|nr:PREDICTED: zinc finger MYM-type protein 1-like [Amphimedon queenslandica]|eukprot:XP_003389518.1 PREDICTED: zinc finger MYM-type protein 1-like [Amphimedon queenslandica]
MATNATITDYFSLKVPRVADAETDSIHSEISSSDEEIEESSATVTDATHSDSPLPPAIVRVPPDDCSCSCCSSSSSESSSVPVQPDKHFSQKKQGKQTRSFQHTWFQEHSWLTYCVPRDLAFCHICRLAVNKALMKMPRKRGHHVFITDGFSNWKKAKCSFKKHERSQLHREAVVKIVLQQQPSVATQLSRQSEKDHKHRQAMLMKVLQSIKLLARQGLAIRGHSDEESNLVQVLRCRMADVEGLEAWINAGKYLSHEVTNEIVELMAHALLRNLLVDIRNAKFFALICDETQDISGLEQFTISFRWIDPSYEVQEDLIGLVQVDTTDAASLTGAIKDVLIRCNIDIHNCRGQTYDGATNMSGPFSGVATRLRQEEPRAHFKHCAAHCLNLCLQECAQRCSAIRDALSLCKEVYNLICTSPKRLAKFKLLQQQLHPDAAIGLRPICPTRWTVRTAALNSILKNYDVIMQDLEEISEAGIDASSKAAGAVALMEKFSTFFGIKLSYLLFGATEQTSVTLQAKDIGAEDALSSITAAASFLNRQRNESAFHLFYQCVVWEAKEFTDDPVLPRPRKVPKRYDDGSSIHVFENPEQLYRKKYYKAIDLIIAEIDRRFDQPTLLLLKEKETILIESCNGKNIELSPTMQEMYQADINMEKLKLQQNMLPDEISTVNKNANMGIHHVTRVSTVCQVFNVGKLPKSMLKEVDTLLHLFLTIPLTTASAERSFSTLRRLKNYLRSTMTQKRLNHLILLHTHKKGTTGLDLRSIADDFISKNNRRVQFFGK